MASIDPKSGEVREYNLPGNKATAYGIAMDKQGRIWYTKYLENDLGMLDPETSVATERQMPHKNSADRIGWRSTPSSGCGFRRAAWGSSRCSTSPRARLPSTRFPSRIRFPIRCAWMGHGAVWVTGNGADSLYRFDPERKTFTTYRHAGTDILRADGFD